MGFKLVRTDSVGPNKILLPLGTHLIGRGKFLDCEDKRISRSHGNLIVNEHSVTIESLHQNPCFWTKKGTKEIQILKKSCQETLQNGDRFGLLPGSFWYEVLQITESDSEATDASYTQEQNYCENKEISNDNLHDHENRTHDETIQNSHITANDGENKEISNDNLHDHENRTHDETIQNSHITANDGENKEISNDILHDHENRTHDETIQNSHITANDGAENNDKDDSELMDFDLNETADDVGRPESPSVLDQETEQQTANQPTNEPEANVDTSHGSNQPDEAASSIKTEPSSPSPKRSHSPDTSEESVKKIKKEPDEVKPDVLKQDPDSTAGPSNDQVAASSPDDGNKAPAPAPAPARERCFYADNCYRKNPQHLAQFSHPRDADWGAAARAPCPRGAACRARDPRHHRLHEHPPGQRPPPPAGAQVVERRGNVYYINARSVNFYDDHFNVEDSDGDSVDFDYEF